MASRAHRWKGDDTPLTGVHGGTLNAAQRAIAASKALRAFDAAVIARLDSQAPVRRDRLRPKAQSARERAVERISALQEGRCSLCGDLFGRGPLAPTIEHVLPRSRGGGNVGNRLVAHSACNAAKGDRMPTERELKMLRRINALLAGTAV